MVAITRCRKGCRYLVREYSNSMQIQCRYTVKIFSAGLHLLIARLHVLSAGLKLLKEGLQILSAGLPLLSGVLHLGSLGLQLFNAGHRVASTQLREAIP